MSHRKRKARRLAKILARRKTSPSQTMLPPGELLNDIAYVLNMAEVSGAPVELAHGAVLTDFGYVFRVGDVYGQRWAARTRVLTEFPPAPPGDDD